MRIVWTEQAQEDMDKIYAFWQLQNPQYAIKLYNSFIDEAERLLSFPQIGHLENLLQHRNENFRSLVIDEHNKLVYTIEGEDIVIHTVWDCRQNPKKLIKKV